MSWVVLYTHEYGTDLFGPMPTQEDAYRACADTALDWLGELDNGAIEEQVCRLVLEGKYREAASVYADATQDALGFGESFEVIELAPPMAAVPGKDLQERAKRALAELQEEDDEGDEDDSDSDLGVDEDES